MPHRGHLSAVRTGLTSSQVGAYVESLVTAELISYGYEVVKPVDPSSRFDLGVVRGGRIIRLQIKAAAVRKGCVNFLTCSKTVRSNYCGDCELIVCYCPDTGSSYAVRPEDAPNTMISLRITPAMNFQHQSVRYAEDYRLKAVLAKLESEIAGPPSMRVVGMADKSKRRPKRSKAKLAATA
jgi:hypothetical protein